MQKITQPLISCRNPKYIGEHLSGSGFFKGSNFSKKFCLVHRAKYPYNLKIGPKFEDLKKGLTLSSDETRRASLAPVLSSFFSTLKQAKPNPFKLSKTTIRRKSGKLRN
jgi:hypothetical protein